MGKIQTEKNLIKQMFEGRAARVCTVAVSVFLCVLTVIWFVALYMEWEIPVLKEISGDEAGWFKDDDAEIALDQSTYNVPFEEEPETQIKEEKSAQKQENMEGEADVVPQMETESPSDDLSWLLAEKYPYYIRVNRRQNCITIYIKDEDGAYQRPYKVMACSTGLYNATPRGTFQLSDKYLWRELFGGVYGQYATRITGGVLFHSVPYYRKSKNALCTDKYNKLGQQASMGCIRLTVADAKWIAENCPKGTTVEIYDDDVPGPLGKPETLKIDTKSPNKGWDPTDPDPDNPWMQDVNTDSHNIHNDIN